MKQRSMHSEHVVGGWGAAGGATAHAARHARLTPARAALCPAVAAAVEPDHTQSLARQKMLESPWIFDRLRFLIDVLQQRNAKLVALAAVKDAGQQFEG